MRKFLLSIKFLIIFNFLLLNCSYLFKGISFAQQRIRFKEIYYDFGEVKRDEILNHIFEFENTGNSVLTIKAISSDCSCVTTNLSGKKDFQPKEKGQIEVQFSPSAYIEEVQEKVILVHSNDPDFPIFKLTLMAKVRIVAVVEPRYLNFYLNPDSTTRDSKKITFKNKIEHDLTVTSIEPEKDFIDYSLLNADKLPLTIKPDQSLVIMVSLKNKNLQEPLSGHLKINTDNIDCPTFKVLITKILKENIPDEISK